MSGMTIKQALAVIQTEVNWHAGSDTHYRAERLEQSLATLRAEIDGLRAEVTEWKRVASAQAELHGEAEARAERLAEALLLAEEHIDSLTPEWYSAGQRVLATIRAALHPTAAQENDDA